MKAGRSASVSIKHFHSNQGHPRGSRLGPIEADEMGDAQPCGDRKVQRICGSQRLYRDLDCQFAGAHHISGQRGSGSELGCSQSIERSRDGAYILCIEQSGAVFGRDGTTVFGARPVAAQAAQALAH